MLNLLWPHLYWTFIIWNSIVDRLSCCFVRWRYMYHTSSKYIRMTSVSFGTKVSLMRQFKAIIRLISDINGINCNTVFCHFTVKKFFYSIKILKNPNCVFFIQMNYHSEWVTLHSFIVNQSTSHGCIYSTFSRLENACTNEGIWQL